MKLRVVFLAILILIVALAVHRCMQPSQTPLPVIDQPTEQEQQALEESQEEPDSVPEEEMENQSPENAEQD